MKDRNSRVGVAPKEGILSHNKVWFPPLSPSQSLLSLTSFYVNLSFIPNGVERLIDMKPLVVDKHVLPFRQTYPLLFLVVSSLVMYNICFWVRSANCRRVPWRDPSVNHDQRLHPNQDIWRHDCGWTRRGWRLPRRFGDNYSESWLVGCLSQDDSRGFVYRIPLAVP